jgi:hypothetical protein
MFVAISAAILGSIPMENALALVSRAEKTTRRINTRLLGDIQKAANEERVRNEAGRRERRRREMEHSLRLHRRVAQATDAVLGICAIGRTKQLRSLIKGRGKPLTLFGGVYVSPGNPICPARWDYISQVYMTMNQLVIKNRVDVNGAPHGVFPTYHIRFSYDITDRPTIAQRLRPLATESDLLSDYDEEEVPEIFADDVNFHYSVERLFDVLVSWHEDKNLTKALRFAL